MMLVNKQALLLLVAALAWRAEGRAVVQEDVKGVKTLLQDEARDDPFFDHNPQYDFAYRIHDEETGDAKDQTEERRGDAVHGSYSVVDPDGTLRVVRYTADDANGFNAIVSLTPGHSKPIVSPTLKSLQQRLNVVQHHVDVPVPVQHHVLPSSSEQIVGNRRVLVEHPMHQASAQVHQHLIQPPLAFGLHQDVHHIIPQSAYQLHQIHQFSAPGAGIHHQMPLQMGGIQDQGLLNQQQQQQQMAIAQIQQEQGSLKQQQQQMQLQLQQQQQQQEMNIADPQKQLQLQIQQQQDMKIAAQQQQLQLQHQQDMQIAAQQQDLKQGLQEDAQQAQQGQQSLQQQDNTIQEQGQIGGFSLPQVIEVRHSVQNQILPSQQQLQTQLQQQLQQQGPQVQQLRSLDSGMQAQAAFPHQRTLALYRTSPTSGRAQGSNFITFSSPYAQYTIS